MPNASLYELLKYYGSVGAIRKDLTDFRESVAQGTIGSMRCTLRISSQIPSWTDDYIKSIVSEGHRIFSTLWNSTVPC